MPSQSKLAAVVRKQQALERAFAQRDEAIRAAAEDGWSLRQIAAVVHMSPEGVRKGILRASSD
jgi:hypothetical protein